MSNSEVLGQMWEDLKNMSPEEKAIYNKRLEEKIKQIEEEEWMEEQERTRLISTRWEELSADERILKAIFERKPEIDYENAIKTLNQIIEEENQR